MTAGSRNKRSSRRTLLAGIGAGLGAVVTLEWPSLLSGSGFDRREGPDPCDVGDPGCPDPVSVREHRFAGGAKGDGRTDDSCAIQAAIDAAPAVYLPAGTYRIAVPLALPSNRRLFGAGEASVLRKADEAVDRLVVNADPAGNENIIIEKLVVDGSRTSTAYRALKDGICLSRCRRSAVRDVTVRNCLNNGIIVEYGSGNSIVGCRVQGNAKDGIYVSGSASVGVDANEARGNLLAGVAVAATRGARVTNNRCSGNRVDILLARDSRLVEVLANDCASLTAFAVSPEPITGQVLNGVSYPRRPERGWDRLYGAASCLIRGNRFAGQVRLVLVSDSRLDANLCTGSSAQGVVLQGASGNEVTGNTVENWNPDFAGIQLAPLAASDGVPLSQQPPIASSGNVVTGNIVRRPVAARTAVQDTGSGNRVAANRISGPGD